MYKSVKNKVNVSLRFHSCRNCELGQPDLYDECLALCASCTGLGHVISLCHHHRRVWILFLSRGQSGPSHGALVAAALCAQSLAQANGLHVEGSSEVQADVVLLRPTVLAAGAHKMVAAGFYINSELNTDDGRL